jgi:hypothetical protein
MADDMANSGPNVTVATITDNVVAGLDPAIHHFGKRFLEDRWIRGPSPVKTAGARHQAALGADPLAPFARV